MTVATPEVPTSTVQAPPPARQRGIADPIPMAAAVLAIQLTLYVFRWISVTPATLATSPLTTAVNYSILTAAIAQIGAGVLCLIRGSAYTGYIATTFGIWLLGFYLLATNPHADPDAVAWYLFALIVPLVLIMVPAVVHRRIAFVIAFGAIIVLLFLAGFAFHDVHNVLAAAEKAKSAPDLSTAVDLLRASAWFALITVLALFWLVGRGVLEGAGVLRPDESHDH